MTILQLPVDRTGDSPLHRQIYDGLRHSILEGALRPGQRLPSTRALAADLAISRQPVLVAYEQLLHEGYIEGRTGAGTFVSGALPDDLLASLPRSSAAAAGIRHRIPKHFTSDIGRLKPFRLSVPALDAFPHTLWSRLLVRHARHTSYNEMVYGDAAGLPELRIAIAEHLRVARGVTCDAEQVLVVSGSQAALRLCAAVLLRRGDVAAMEEPGYFGAHMAFLAHGAELKHVPVDDQGLSVTALAALGRGIRAVHVTPSHQYPLGTTMSVARRLALLEWAREQDAWVLEDDYDSEYRYASRPIGSLQGMAPGRVIYIGTFSKVLFPAMRVGYLVAPPALARAFAEARVALDLFSPPLYQKVLAEFLREGHFARHLRRMRAIYRSRRDALLEGLERHARDDLTVLNADAGLHMAVLLESGREDREVLAGLHRHRLTATSLWSCYYGTGARRQGLLLGFGGSTERALLEATRTLGEVLRDRA